MSLGAPTGTVEMTNAEKKKKFKGGSNIIRVLLELSTSGKRF